jgi:hypothetical protein
MVMKRRSLYASTRFVETILGTCSCRRGHSTTPFLWFFVRRTGTGLRGRLAARSTWCDRVEATLLGSLDGLFEGPALGCEELD